jgi:hypothetical protein
VGAVQGRRTYLCIPDASPQLLSLTLSLPPSTPIPPSTAPNRCVSLLSLHWPRLTGATGRAAGRTHPQCSFPNKSTRPRLCPPLQNTRPCLLLIPLHSLFCNHCVNTRPVSLLSQRWPNLLSTSAHFLDAPPNNSSSPPILCPPPFCPHRPVSLLSQHWPRPRGATRRSCRPPTAVHRRQRRPCSRPCSSR